MPHLALHTANVALMLPLKLGTTLIGRSDRCDLALPSEEVSRVHAAVERRTEGFWLNDRSRLGTRVNGAAARRHLLADGDEIEIGPYTLTFKLRDGDPPTTRMVQHRPHEELVEASPSGLAALRAVLHVDDGAPNARTVVLTSSRVSAGGPGSTVVLGDELPRDAVRLRIVRGRVLVEPGTARSTLAGQPVRELTPVYPGEEIRVGEHRLALATEAVEEPAESAHGSFGAMVSRSAPMKAVFGALERVAAHDAPVLLVGESGTGKELAARGIHEAGLRRGGPFEAINCASIAENLFESELFGHEKGAFTGAAARQDGAFQRAAGGTLFLDEVGELAPDVQAKLLRALETGEVLRVGGSRAEYPDVRIVAATHRNLPRMVRAGTFREDLYFRLAVLTVRLPPLRERPEDVATIAAALLARQHPGASLSADAVKRLEGHAWPGNVRELRNVLTRAVVMGGPAVTAASLEFNPWAFDDEDEDDHDDGDGGDDSVERQQVLAALGRARGNKTRAARELGVPRSSLLYRLKRLGIEVK